MGPVPSKASQDVYARLSWACQEGETLCTTATPTASTTALFAVPWLKQILSRFLSILSGLAWGNNREGGCVCYLFWYLRFIASAISALPFIFENEPLLLIFAAWRAMKCGRVLVCTPSTIASNFQLSCVDNFYGSKGKKHRLHLGSNISVSEHINSYLYL